MYKKGHSGKQVKLKKRYPAKGRFPAAPSIEIKTAVACGCAKKDLRHAGRLFLFTLMREKEGVYVLRGRWKNRPVVVKYFAKKEHRREIENYRLLAQAGIPTMRVWASGQAALLLEDISASATWRLGLAEDLQNPSLARRLAHWYFALHENGGALLAENPTLAKALYCEYDAVTKESILLLEKKLPDAWETFAYISSNMEKLAAIRSGISETFTYNDFYWTNLLAEKTGAAAMMFDYNLLGRGPRMGDLRNVCSSLTPDAGKAFTDEYNRLYGTKHGTEIDWLAETRIDNVLAPLVTLIFAYEKPVFPAWAEEPRQQAVNGALLLHAKKLFGA